MEEEPRVFDRAVTPKLFGKWSYEDIKIDDETLADHISIRTAKAKVFTPHTAGRWQKKRFHKTYCPIVERLVVALMYHGRNNGKKLMAVRHVEQAFELIALLKPEQNPLQVYVSAVCHGGPREDSCRVGSAGVVRLQAVDVSPLRRVNKAIYLMAKGVREKAFRNIKSLAECLADEIIEAAENSNNSFAVRKREETERGAKSNR